MASPEVWEEVSGGDTGMTNEGNIVSGIGVDVDIAPPNTVRVGKAQKEELAGMSNELKRMLREIQRRNWAKTEESAVAMCSVVAGRAV